MEPRSLLALILAAGSWGLGTVISKRAVEEIPPLTLLSIQLAASVVALSVLMRWRNIALRDRAASPILGRLGLLNPGLAYALSLIGLTSITASLSVLLWTAEPILILMLAALVLHERVGVSFVVLSAIAVGGMLLVLYEPGTGGALGGVALTLAGVVCCAVYTVAARRWIGTTDETASIVLAQQAWALVFAICVLAATVLAGAALLPTTVSTFAWASAIGSGVIYYGAAYWFYLFALRRVPAATAAASFYLIPVFGVGGGVGLLGEALSGAQWIGAFVVVVAVYLILRQRREIVEVEAVGPRPACLEPDDTMAR
jgi:drug/metabolite transporter (DMT)-like permease